LLYDSPGDAHVRECAFVANRPAGSFTIAVCSGAALLIAGCCFSGTREREVRSANARVVDCAFETQNCGEEISWEVAQYRPGRASEAIAGPEGEAELGEEEGGGETGVAALIGVSALWAAGSALVLTAVHIAVRHSRKGRKLPMAFR
jgi:hypothetical protein